MISKWQCVCSHHGALVALRRGHQHLAIDSSARRARRRLYTQSLTLCTCGGSQRPPQIKLTSRASGVQRSQAAHPLHTRAGACGEARRASAICPRRFQDPGRPLAGGHSGREAQKPPTTKWRSAPMDLSVNRGGVHGSGGCCALDWSLWIPREARPRSLPAGRPCLARAPPCRVDFRAKT